MDLHPDLMDLLGAFSSLNVEYLVVGGWAVSVHSEPRFTNDLDLLIGTAEDNLERAAHALQLFGAPESIVNQARSLRPERIDVIWHRDDPPVESPLVRPYPPASPQQNHLSSRALFRQGLRLSGVGERHPLRDWNEQLSFGYGSRELTEALGVDVREQRAHHEAVLLCACGFADDTADHSPCFHFAEQLLNGLASNRVGDPIERRQLGDCVCVVE